MSAVGHQVLVCPTRCTAIGAASSRTAVGERLFVLTWTGKGALSRKLDRLEGVVTIMSLSDAALKFADGRHCCPSKTHITRGVETLPVDHRLPNHPFAARDYKRGPNTVKRAAKRLIHKIREQDAEVVMPVITSVVHILRAISKRCACCSGVAAVAEGAVVSFSVSSPATAGAALNGRHK
jgi:hypothetical protein